MDSVKNKKIVVKFISIIFSVIILSLISSMLWISESEKIDQPGKLVISKGMDIASFGEVNKIPKKILQKFFDLRKKDDSSVLLSETGKSEAQIEKGITKLLAIYAESGRKNWRKITIKFVLWFIFLTVVFILIRKNKIDTRMRVILYITAISIFGVIMGSDPSPMGTVKDAITLFASRGVIFIPRLIALSIFLFLVVVANKFICSWGCQLGTLQDLIFRLNRNKKDNKGIIRQYKPSFFITNTIRIVFFLIFIAVAFLWAFDLIEKIDPFKIFHPDVVVMIGWIFIGSILVLSLFIYRPWCHLFCPFGLVGWIFEKLSIFKIRVNYETCISCEACEKACPSTVMSAILKREKVIPDCFSCYTCANVCPTDSISFSSGKREKPPEGKFEKNSD